MFGLWQELRAAWQEASYKNIALPDERTYRTYEAFRKWRDWLRTEERHPDSLPEGSMIRFKR